MTDGTCRCCAERRADDPALKATASATTIAPSETPIPRHWSSPIGGSFVMGSEDKRFADDGEGPVRRVNVATFAIACYSVSNVQFAEFVRQTGYTTDAERYGWSFVFEGLLWDDARREPLNRAAETPWWVAVSHAYWAQPEGPHSTILGRSDHPVVHTSWNDAKAYCQWSGTRLPTEAEWEMAARGGLEQATFPWGNELTPAGQHRCNIWQGQFPDLNTMEDGYLGTAPVHAFAANGYGLYNVAGNVWEWCEDTFSPRYHQVTAAVDPFHNAPAPNRSLRGGSFLCHDSYCNRYRVAARSSNTPDSSASNIGFRVVRPDVDAPMAIAISPTQRL
jgi:sulfatase modifying factor 1